MKVRTVKGEMLDMGQLVSRNERAVALGNASMNARGDIVAANGKVLRRREQVAQDYYASNPKAVKSVALRDISTEVFVSPAEAVAATKAKHESAAADANAHKKARKIVDKED